eukprot:48927-Eustigmatos_ZCMA.PRE.1
MRNGGRRGCVSMTLLHKIMHFVQPAEPILCLRPVDQTNESGALNTETIVGVSERVWGVPS